MTHFTSTLMLMLLSWGVVAPAFYILGFWDGQAKARDQSRRDAEETRMRLFTGRKA